MNGNTGHSFKQTLPTKIELRRAHGMAKPILLRSDYEEVLRINLVGNREHFTVIPLTEAAMGDTNGLE